MMKLLLKRMAEAPPPDPEPEPEPEPSSPESIASKSNSVIHRKPITRTPMGDYIIQPGGKPLTSLGDPCAGPADYYPTLNLTKPSAAQYSIVGRQKPKEQDKTRAGPADYGTSGDLIWKKQYALKGRTKCYFDEEASKYSTDLIGPAKYNVRYRNLGEGGPKYSMAHKQPQDIITGPPNSMVQPVDTHGDGTPGPNYRPNSRYWTRGSQKSMGIARKQKVANGPGPADHDIQSPKSGPAKSFGIKLPPPPNIQRTVNKFSPGPNSYDLGTTIGSATAKSISGRHPETPLTAMANATPSPATYYPGQKKKKKSVTLAYRWFDIAEPVRPGPADYGTTKMNMKKDPAYTVRQQTKPSYPESLNYVSKEVEDTPGAGNYQIARNILHNESPAYSMKQQLKTVESDVPAPNKYAYEKKGNDRGAKFSMGKRFNMPNAMSDNPGPGSYSPKLSRSAPKYSMKGRTEFIGKTAVIPGPNAYSIPPGIKLNDRKCGATLKSRPSPYVYSGFRSRKLIEPKA